MYKKRLLELGIPADIKGFEYLNCAIQAYRPTQSIINLYDQVAIVMGTTSTKAERAIRHAISKTGQKITNGAFVAKYKILWEDEKQCI